MTESKTHSEAALLGELLAVIHRDGGQYAIQHGTEKATQDAIQIVAAIHAARMPAPVAEVSRAESAEARLADAVKAEREECATIAEGEPEWAGTRIARKIRQRGGV
jgi:hypothetical protein